MGFHLPRLLPGLNHKSKLQRVLARAFGFSEGDPKLED